MSASVPSCRLFLLLFLAHCCAKGRAQHNNYSFIHYSTDQGLSNDHIQQILKDPLGFIWIGTINGLNRFDGRSFRVFRHEAGNPASLPGNHITGISLAPDGQLWVSTDNGLCQLDPRRLVLNPNPLPGMPDSLRKELISMTVFDKKGRLWCCGKNNLYCYNFEKNTFNAYPTLHPNAGHWRTQIDHKERIWMMNVGKITRFDPANNTSREFHLDKEQNGVLKNAASVNISMDQNGAVWISTWNNGLALYDPIRDELIDYPDPFTLATSILPDTSDSGRPFFWMGGGKNGLMLYYFQDHQHLEIAPNPLDAYAHNNALVYPIFKDHASGNVWIGTEQGLEVYSPTSIRFGRNLLPVTPDMSQFSLVSEVIRDKTDPSGQTYYIGVWGSGVFKWNRTKNTFQRFHLGNSPIVNNEIFGIIQDQKGYLWMHGGFGVNRLDPRSGQWRVWRNFFKENGLVFNKILSMFEDSRGNIWLGSNRQGLFRFNAATNRVDSVPLPPAAMHPNGRLYITSIVEDSLGRLWLGSNNRFIRYNPVDGEARAFFVDGPTNGSLLTVTRDGSIWAAAGKWLVHLDLDGRVLQKYSTDNGLKSGGLFGIAEDAHGRLWCNSDYLLHCFDPQTGQFTYYGKADGLFSNAPTDGLSLLDNGEIFIGFQNAFNFFDPVRLRRNTAAPPVVITAIKVLNKEKDLLAQLVLHPGENMLTVEFAALNYSQPERNRYAYKLEGFDPDWVYTDRPLAVYTNLDGGEYTLRLKAANNDGVWNESGATLTFLVIPPVYERWYFRLALTLLLGWSLYLVVLYRERQRRRMDAFRERLARDLHDEMGSTLSSIRFFSEFAQTQIAGSKPETLPILQRISQSASALSESMQDIIWAMKTRYDQLDDLSSRMTELGLRITESRGIRLKTHFPEQLPDKRLSPEQRRNLYLIFKEALNNAAKYAQCTEVTLSLRFKKNLLVLEIADNGQGFDPEKVDKGNGLHNMRQRAQEIGGELELSTAPGQGVRILVRMSM